jgi:Transcriptional regulator
MNINLSFLESFLVVASTGSFTTAAKKLFVTQPAVSQHISSLEKELGVKLFMRRGRGIVLTEEGRFLQHKAEELMRTLADVQTRLQDQSELRRGTIRLAVTELPVFLLPPVLLEFKKRYPGVDVSISCYTSPQAISKVDSGDADVAFARNIVETLPGMERQFVHREHLVLAAPSWHPLQEAEWVTQQMLAHEAMALRERGTFTREVASSWFKENELTMNIIEHNTMAGLREMVLYGCLALLPRGVISLDIIRKRIVVLPTALKDISIDYYCYKRKGEVLSRPVTAFLELLASSGQFSNAEGFLALR